MYRTSEVLEETGITRQMLYYYAQIGLLTEAERTPGGHRRWGEDVFVKIDLILKLNKSGYPLRDIREIFFRRSDGRYRATARRRKTGRRSGRTGSGGRKKRSRS